MNHTFWNHLRLTSVQEVQSRFWPSSGVDPDRVDLLSSAGAGLRPPTTAEGTHFSTLPSPFIFGSIFPNGRSDCCELIGFCNMGMHVIKIFKIHHIPLPFS